MGRSLEVGDQQLWQPRGFHNNGQRGSNNDVIEGMAIMWYSWVMAQAMKMAMVNGDQGKQGDDIQGDKSKEEQVYNDYSNGQSKAKEGCWKVKFKVLLSERWKLWVNSQIRTVCWTSGAAIVTTMDLIAWVV